MTNRHESENSNETNPFLRTYEDWRNRTPIFCRYVSQGILIAYALSWWIDLTFLFANMPYKTLYKLQFYRLVSSPLAGNSILGSLFAILTMGDGVGPRLERSFGTIAFMSSILVAIICINTLYLALLSSLALGGAPDIALIPSQGVWPFLMYAISIEALSGPEASRKLLCLPIDIPRNYYPFALLFLFFLMAGPQLDLFLGIALGYADQYKFLSYSKASPSLISRIESMLPSSIVNDAGFISARSALGSAAWVQLSESAPWADSTNQHSRTAVSSFLSAFRMNRGASPPESSTSSHNNDFLNHNHARFPEAQGHVLGSAPSHSPVDPPASDCNQIQVAVPVKTAAANRATILAAVEKRTSPDDRV